MEKHLKKCIDPDLDEEISPISQIDAEIIVEIIEIVKKMGYFDFSNILHEWKKRSDDVIRDSLIDYGLNFESIESKNESDIEVFKRVFIQFENASLDIYNIKSISRKKKFNVKTGNYDYQILINEFTSEITPYHGLCFLFEDEETMEIKYEEIHELLIQTNTINFY